MSRLSVQLDGRPVYLYSFLQGQYEDTWRYLCAHSEQLTHEEVRARLLAAAAQLPKEIELDFLSSAPTPDLFEQALVFAGFEVVDNEIERMRVRAFPPTTDRERLLRALETAT